LAYTASYGRPVRSASARGPIEIAQEGRSMKMLKSQAFRVLLALSAIASSALVLEAGQRWR